MTICYQESGKRAFLLDGDGFTICEVIAPANNSAVSIAKKIVERYQQAADLAQEMRKQNEFIRISLAAENDRLERNSTLEKEIEQLKADIAMLHESEEKAADRIEEFEKELTALREFKAAIEAQEPVAWRLHDKFGYMGVCTKENIIDAVVGDVVATPLFTNKLEKK